LSLEDRSFDVVVAGGGNAALVAALTAREEGAAVLLLEGAPREWRGGNSQHTRNMRCMHEAPQDVLTEAYPEAEYWEDLARVTGGNTDEHLARMAIRGSSSVRPWMKGYGVHFQHALGGTLHLSRTNAFFLGGGKALVNAYYRAAKALGVAVAYEATVEDVEMEGAACAALHVRYEGRTHRVRAKAFVVAAGGFESNREWLREAWGPVADNFVVRGTRFNQGRVLKALLDHGVAPVADPLQGHMVAVDARAPAYDGGIVTRVDCVSLGIVVNRDGERFYDEGEDFWPKRYAIWGRLVANQPGQIAYSVIDSKSLGRFMPPVFPGESASTIPELARKLGLDAQKLLATVERFNAATRPGTFSHTALDDCRTEGLAPAKTHWARPIDTPPYYGFALCPGVTFTYLGVKVDERAQVLLADGARARNLFAAGEIMAGNILGRGYLAGIGMTIGTVFGRIAGMHAAQCAAGTP
jgi:tricarballylate dehydrogenase